MEQKCSSSFFEFAGPGQVKQQPIPKLVENVCDDNLTKKKPVKNLKASLDFFELKDEDSHDHDQETKYTETTADLQTSSQSSVHSHSPSCDSEKKFKFSCKICGQNFEKSQQLGGHQSKRHPNQSSIYQNKQIRRNERKDDRQLLMVTKKYLRQLHPTVEFNDMRSKIQQFRMKVLKNCKDNTTMSLDDAGFNVYQQLLKKQQTAAKWSDQEPNHLSILEKISYQFVVTVWF